MKKCNLAIDEKGNSNINELTFFKDGIYHHYTGDVAKMIIKNIALAVIEPTPIKRPKTTSSIRDFKNKVSH